MFLSTNSGGTNFGAVCKGRYQPRWLRPFDIAVERSDSSRVPHNGGWYIFKVCDYLCIHVSKTNEANCQGILSKTFIASSWMDDHYDKDHFLAKGTIFWDIPSFSWHFLNPQSALHVPEWPALVSALSLSLYMWEMHSWAETAKRKPCCLTPLLKPSRKHVLSNLRISRQHKCVLDRM